MESRNVRDVIDQMLIHIPKEEKGLKYGLISLKEDSFFVAPENTVIWDKIYDLLQNEIKYPQFDWEFEILSIFSTIPVEIIKPDVYQ